jgi:hypothetical protein
VRGHSIESGSPGRAVFVCWGEIGVPGARSLRAGVNERMAAPSQSNHITVILKMLYPRHNNRLTVA